MQITRNSSETAPGPSGWFTGAVFIDTGRRPRGRVTAVGEQRRQDSSLRASVP